MSSRREGWLGKTPARGAARAALIAAALLSVSGLSASGCSGCDDGPGHPALYNPSLANVAAPPRFRARFDTTAGSFSIECVRDWAPNGVDRFYNLISIGFYDNVAFFRVVREPRPFVVQFGIHGEPKVNRKWLENTILPDEPKKSNQRGTVAFAMSGEPDTRATQVFFNLSNNGNLDGMGFAPICTVLGDGMNIVDRINGEYGDDPSRHQPEIAKQGNKWLKEKYPKLDYIKTVTLEDLAPSDGSTKASSSSRGP